VLRTEVYNLSMGGIYINWWIPRKWVLFIKLMKLACHFFPPIKLEL